MTRAEQGAGRQDGSDARDGSGLEEVFVARQPIFDRQQKVFAYELLFRSGLTNAFDGRGANEATAKVMVNSLIVFGLPKLTGDRLAFINMTRDALVSGFAHLFPKDLVVPEVLEDVVADPAVVEACRSLRDAGYLVALDDVVEPGRFAPFSEAASIVKVDFMDTDPDMQARFAKELLPHGVRLLAEKVETKEEFTRAVELGYELFQGYFFAKPEVMQTRDVPAGQMQYLRLMREIYRVDADVDDLERLIKQDLSLTYRLLRYINSAYFGMPVKVHSIRHALSLLGLTNVRKWATLIAMASMGEAKPPELLRTGLARGRFCELLGPECGLSDYTDDLFLVGLFSVLDAVTDRPMSEAIEELSVAHPIAQALLERDGPIGEVLQVVLLLEAGQWHELGEKVAKIRAPDRAVTAAYVQALAWAQDNTNGM